MNIQIITDPNKEARDKAYGGTTKVLLDGQELPSFVEVNIKIPRDDFISVQIEFRVNSVELDGEVIVSPKVGALDADL